MIVLFVYTKLTLSFPSHSFVPSPAHSDLDAIYERPPIGVAPMHRLAQTPTLYKFQNIINQSMFNVWVLSLDRLMRGYELGHDRRKAARWCRAPLPRCVMIIISLSNIKVTLPCPGTASFLHPLLCHPLPRRYICASANRGAVNAWAIESKIPATLETTYRRLPIPFVMPFPPPVLSSLIHHHRGSTQHIDARRSLSELAPPFGTHPTPFFTDGRIIVSPTSAPLFLNPTGTGDDVSSSADRLCGPISISNPPSFIHHH